MSSLLSLHRYPIKSMQGESIETATLSERGLAGDRGYGIIDPAPRCIVTTLAQNTLPRDRDVLRTIAEYNSAPSHTAAPGYMLAAVAGVYASVVAGGMARVGDMLSLEPG